MKPLPRPSWRKGAGILIILLLILIWAALVANLAGRVGRWPGFVQAAFYLFMGVAWIIPLKPLIRWTETGRWRTPPKPKS
jgi:predicted membrane channel-forming protein YqfA (hemolysin III family)